MKLLYVFLLITLFSISVGVAQEFPDLSKYQTNREKMGMLYNYCNSLLTKGLNDRQDCSNMVIASKMGIQLCKNGDEYVSNLFTIFVGYGYEFERVHLDSAIYYYEKGLDQSRRLKFDFNIDRITERLNGLYFDTRRLKQREELIAVMRNILDTTTNMTRKVVLSGSVSEYYLSVAKYEEAIKFNLKNIEYQKLNFAKNKTALLDNIGSKYVQIGSIFNTMGQYNKAIEYYDLAGPYFKVYRIGKITLFMNYVLVHLKLDEVEKAKIYYKKMYSLMKPTDSAFHELSSANQYLADYYNNKNNTSEAFKFANEALRMAKKSGNEQSIVNANKTYGSVLYKRGSTKESVNYLQKAALNAYGFSKEDYASIQIRLAVSYADLANWELAYKHAKNYAELKDTLYQEASKKTLAELEARFQNNAKKQEIKLLNIESSNKSIQLKEEKKTRWLLMSVALFAFLSACLIYWNYRNKQKINIILDKKNQELDLVNLQLNNANQTKTKLFSIISHDLRSPVSQLFTFLRIQQINPTQISEENKLSHQKKLMESATKLLETMEDLLLWSKSQMDHFELDIEEVDIHQLFEEAIALMQNQADAKNVKIEIGNLALNNLQSDQNLLIIVLRNLLQNAINHSYNGTSIFLNAGIYEDKKQFISVINKSDVISKEKIDELLSSHNVKSKSSGYGLVIVKEMLQKLNGDLKIESSSEATVIGIVFS
ncbi:HAMP domain-containing histidine kinase [Pedobacter frigiditerrae]|uniref:histidine kinase n=1 Tax=Pedobacter frigiditerrae TaxID=2530452 RepID=A0A4R0ML54_9SPHI|nr:HAMP domain-containing sensor histidine kinase [Pedobacter frigiditerrae]TCC86912.1 HAMP domain-containing histidine kinase [Pedobacter frigiditerrae]